MRKLFLKIASVCGLAGCVVSCGFGGATSSTSTTFLSGSEEVVEQLGKLMDYAGTTADKVEFIELTISHDAEDTTDISNIMIIDIIDPKDANHVKNYQWFDTPALRNSYQTREVTMTDSWGQEVIEGHDKFVDQIFTYADLKPYFDNYAVFTKEAMEDSGYGENAYISHFNCSVARGASFTVAYKGKHVSKSYDVADDKMHIKK